MSSARPIRFIHRGETVEVGDAATTRTLLDWLREDARCTGTKEGCNEGDCGACTVLLAERRTATDGTSTLHLAPVNACLQFLPAVDGKAVLTVQDLAQGKALHPVQQAMVECHASQCGFCTPGFVMTLTALDARHHGAGTTPTREQVADALSGNLCRCTGYRPIVDAGLRMGELGGPRLDPAPLLGALATLADRAATDDAAGTFRYADPAGATYRAPTTLAAFADERLADPAARVLGGCTDMGLWTNKQFRALPSLLATGRVAELHRLDVAGDVLHIGAAVSLEDAWRALAARWPELGEMWLRFAGAPIRHAGTLGGNVANGSPIGDSPPVLMALDASLVLRRGAVERRLPLADFYLAYMKNALAEGEFVQAIELPLPAAAAAAGHRTDLRAWKISKRFDCDISAVSCGFFLERHADDRIVTARIAFGGMAATVKRAASVEAALVGRPWSRATLDDAKAALPRDYTPMDDLRASAAFRLRVAANLLERLWLETRREDPLAPNATRVWSLPAARAEASGATATLAGRVARALS